ncbi:uncharacterized protein LOC132196692 [Neocloeon triangulifer]|uniref:uncharacterized protein LOC132196692 n=1 Tax=Neocloeon triangulifer TaxID=2078957 RepID=UPI00286F3DC9|nr:uncharacterized protein LOC132196692 [Neocloeon triangulifer]
MAVTIRVCSISVEVLLLSVAFAYGRECGDRNFLCRSANQVQQCVDGVAMGHVYGCDPGLLCDNNSKWGPCISEPEDACCEEGLFPINGSCTIFMSCVHDGQNWSRHFISCAADFVFNPTISRCERKAATFTGCPITWGEESGGGSTTVSVTTTTSPKPPATTTRMPVCSSPGHFPDPDSCRHYYVCSWAAGGGVKAARTQCVSTLLFDTRLRQCVYNTNCGARPF